MGLDQLANDDQNLGLRNQLFSAMTRTRGWLVITGVTKSSGQNYPFYNEIQETKNQLDQHRDYLTFIYRRKPKIEDREYNQYSDAKEM